MKKHIWLKNAYIRARELTRLVGDDRITLYAAQASFYVMISAVPFISLLIAIVSFFIPADYSALLEGYTFPVQLKVVLGSLFDELQHVPTVSLLSVSAVTTLWSASRGMAAIRTGVEGVYHAQSAHRYLLNRIKSLVSTIAFMAQIVLAVALLLFGDFVIGLIGNSRIVHLLTQLKGQFLVLCMCVVFLAIYASIARRSDCVKRGILSHLPGAVFAAVGWIVFSFFYALYIEYFPNASYIYGGLGAICLMMLWLYFCMIILLFGAEINKVYFAWRGNREHMAPRREKT